MARKHARRSIFIAGIVEKYFENVLAHVFRSQITWKLDFLYTSIGKPLVAAFKSSDKGIDGPALKSVSCCVMNRTLFLLQ